jgi:hypothetical protein
MLEDTKAILSKSVFINSNFFNRGKDKTNSFTVKSSPFGWSYSISKIFFKELRIVKFWTRENNEKIP